MYWYKSFSAPGSFIYPDKKNTVSIGYNGVFENRKGGDILVVKDKADVQHQYFIRNKSLRNSIETSWEDKLNTKTDFVLKPPPTGQQDIETNTFGMKASQLSYFSEASYLNGWRKRPGCGYQFYRWTFNRKLPDSTLLTNTKTTAPSDFLHIRRLEGPSNVTVQAGLRTDFNSTYGTFMLPRLSVLWKISHYLSTRLGGGWDIRFLPCSAARLMKGITRILPINTSLVKAERSEGINWDINYHHKVNNWDITVNQMFYITGIQNPS